MLYEQGGHTGTWNTGPVAAHDGRHTPAAGLAGTTVMPHPGRGARARPGRPGGPRGRPAARRVGGRW
ncbi:hypothetical protein GCM10010308_57850 [Streptomyces vinaceusdrappus]|nr:hypothetical protein GCM10010308_57850 [Streptomyces vinaceusdrappus]